jgi:transcription antitermination factor NusG
VIDAVRHVEAQGDFDEVLAKGDAVQVAKGVLAGVQAVLTSTATNGRVEVLMPLFGGVRATVPQVDVARL